MVNPPWCQGVFIERRKNKMLKVKDELVLKAIEDLKSEITALENKSNEVSNRLEDVSDDMKAHIEKELFEEYSKNSKSKLDYLMTFVEEVADEDLTA